MNLRLIAFLLPTVLLAAAEPARVTFTDAATETGLVFIHNNGAFGRRFMPETYGSGAVFFDMDGDGWQDVFLVNSTRFPGMPGDESFPALFRNTGRGRFADVTKASGLEVEMYGMGGAAGDFDNDGRCDLLVTGWSSAHLFRNLGGGKFKDVTEQAGVSDKSWSSSAMWFDYDKDGWLDLVMGRYLDWSPAKDVNCNNTGRGKSYCTPDMYKGESIRLFRNLRDGRFEDVTKAAGVFTSNHRNLGVALLDYDQDGWPDFIVANDGSPNQLFRNSGKGTFVDVAYRAGVAVRENGSARAGMGVDAADFDDSGRPSIIIGNFSNEMLAVYHNEGNGLFVDDAPATNIGKQTLLSLTFGLFFFDYDLDGHLDIFAANGHITNDLPAFAKGVTYAQRPHLFRGLGGRKFDEATATAGPDMERAVVARGAAHADIDGDGDQDILVTTSSGPARLLRNNGGNANGALRVKLTGTTANRDGIGARVDITREDGTRAWDVVRSGSSYLSQSELPVTFGLGRASTVKDLTVTWPSGRVDRLGQQSGGRTLEVKEGAGIVARTSFVSSGGRR